MDVLCGDADLATVLVDAGYADWIHPPVNATPAPVLAVPPAPTPAPTPAPAVASSPPLHLPSATESVKVGDVLEATIVYHAEPGKFFAWKVDDDAIGAFAGISEELNKHFAGSKPDPDFNPAPGEMIKTLFSRESVTL